MATHTEQLRQAVMQADSPEAFIAAVHALYRREDTADELPRHTLVLHLGMAIGMMQRMLDAGEERRGTRGPGAAMGG